MHNAPIVAPLAIGAFIFTFTEIAVFCTRQLPFNRVRFSVRFEMQPWISVNEAFPAFYLTRYIKYINICCITIL